ncbi:MAG: beta-glucosidase [Oligosphaeraceae bacterium]
MEQRIDQILARLSLPQKMALLHGINTMEFGGIPEAGIPRVMCADGPQGIRVEDGTPNTALPCGMALAATWNPRTAEVFGRVIGEEALATGVHVSLGPGFNLMRTPLNGRNFEYYGEDPVLAGKIASGYVRGCQGMGVAATPKHLALNNQEICRTVGDSRCDKKTLRELYLEAFEIVIREARPWMIMSSYNRINGSYASECRYTQQEFCKDECGFDGVMVSDWGGTHAAMEALRGGLDLEMGGCASNWMNAPLGDQLGALKITPEELDDHVRRVLRLILRVTEHRDLSKGQGATDAHGKTARDIACEATTLLKNDGILPLSPRKGMRILLCGPSADFRHHRDLLHSGGSGAVHPRHEVTVREALQARLGDQCVVEYAPGVLFRDAQDFPESLVQECLCEFYDDASALASGKAPFLTLPRKNLTLHFGVALAAGLESTPDILLNRNYLLRVRAKFTPAKDGLWHMGLLASRLGNATLALDGKRLLDESQIELMDNAAEIQVAAGHAYTLEITGYHNVPEEPCECKVLLREDEQLLRRQALDAAARADLVLYVGGSNHHYDREGIGWGDVKDADIPSLELPEGQSSFLAALAQANPRVVVALLGGSVMNVEPWLDSVSALLDLWYPGQECGNVLVDILTGAATPEGHLPFTWGRELSHYACHANGNYPGVRDGATPHVRYDEGIFIGYRHFDRAGITPRFPFGYGLSYTQFDYQADNQVQVTGSLADKSLRLAITGKVRNTGALPGQALVQLYVAQPQCQREERPRKVLRNFTKLPLQPGEEKPFQLTLEWRDFAFFSPADDTFVAEPGRVQLLLADGQSRLFATHNATLA